MRAFDKVFVEAAKKVTVNLTLDERAFSVYYQSKWQTVGGEYTVSVCSDVETPLLSAKVDIKGENIKGNDRELYPSYFRDVTGSFTIAEDDFYRLTGQKKQTYSVPKRGEFTLLNTLEDMQNVPMVKRVLKSVRKRAVRLSPSKTLADPVAQLTIYGALETPLISMMSVGGVPAKYVLFLLHNANKRHGKAFKALCGKIEL